MVSCIILLNTNYKTVISLNKHNVLRKSPMPIRPAPTTYICPSCDWSKTVVPRSDALGYGDFFRSCPACGHAPLESKKPNVAQTTWGQLADSIQRLLR
jgi:hypothetical protein